MLNVAIKALLASWIGLCLLSPGGPGQKRREVVKAEALLSQERVHPGGILKVAVRVKIDKDWHVHADRVSDEFLVPTSLVFTETAGIQVLEIVYPKRILGKYDYSETAIEVFEGEFLIGALVQAAPDAPLKRLTLPAALKYQACNNRGCLPPQQSDIKIEFDVVDASQDIPAIHADVFSKIAFSKAKKPVPAG
ncbi:MAG: protein-disulfide reductase DsbD family protein [Candidatus Aminicenantes bacterium]|nr:protein-disulfide reductase DsbD family protein [Candidatus Aminicenantes bacterium]